MKASVRILQTYESQIQYLLYYSWKVFPRPLRSFAISLCLTIVNKAEWLASPVKHQRSKQRCQDLGWKVHDRAKCFVLCSYTMQELRNQHVSIG